MKRIPPSLVACATALCLTTTSTVAVAAPGTPAPADTYITVDGKTYGPEDGAEVETFEVDADQIDFDASFPTDVSPGQVIPAARWGSSYATSTHRAELIYTGKAKAAANIFKGKRIIRVCFWYSRGGKRLTSKICSKASSTSGRWQAGKEVQKTIRDSLGWNDPKTKFHYETGRINPGVS